MFKLETEEQIAQALLDWQNRMIDERCELDEDGRKGWVVFDDANDFDSQR